MLHDRIDATDEMIDKICEGLVQNAAKIRFLIRLGLPVSRRPNGRPLVFRADLERLQAQRTAAEPQTMTTTQAANGPRWKKTAAGG
ncbi:hypothetical protein ACCQ08_21685 [Comamonas sp. SY3]|uniref:hypothetical protein n=1 Tax=Comamonas sp. SY3 TaxID=3243601 RepID=UPI003592FA68